MQGCSSGLVEGILLGSSAIEPYLDGVASQPEPAREASTIVPAIRMAFPVRSSGQSRLRKTNIGFNGEWHDKEEIDNMATLFQRS